MNEDYSGELSFVEDFISYKSSLGNWSVSVTDICLIAEYTTAEGPHLDDYFFVFLTVPENGWHQASFYAKGRDETLRLLEEKLHVQLTPSLFASAQFKSRIMWPLRLANLELFEVIPKPSKVGRFWQKISGTRDIKLSHAAKSVFLK